MDVDSKVEVKVEPSVEIKVEPSVEPKVEPKVDLRSKLKQRLNGMSKSRKPNDFYESEMIKKKVPDELRTQLMEFIRVKKFNPFPVDLLTKFKDLPKDELDKYIQQIQLALKK